MDAFILEHFTDFHTIILLIIIAVFLWLIGKGADIVVEEAVELSVSWGVPKVIVGSTIVSLGTTLPEASVSVMAAIKGTSGLALGNSMGSIIADTGLILGLSVLMGLIPVQGKTIRTQNRIQVFVVFLLAAFCFPYFGIENGARVSQIMGFIFVALLIVYIVYSVYSTKGSAIDTASDDTEEVKNPIKSFALLIVGVVLIIISSKILIPAVQITATRFGIPDGVIGATLVAFGTSLPELVTSITAVKKGHGELAIGNVIGADILNVLFVVGASASVTKGGLVVPREFFFVQIPFMLAAVIVLRIAVIRSNEYIKKYFGIILLVLYIAYIGMTFWV